MIAAYGGQDWALIENRVLMGASSPLAATQKYVVNQTGGSDTITLTTANLPSHNHTYTHCSTSTNSTTLTTNQMPNHQHESLYQAKTYIEGSGSFSDKPMVLGNALVSNTNDWSTKTTGGGGSHYHSISRTSATTGSEGSGTSVNVLNPYYVVYTWTRTV